MTIRKTTVTEGFAFLRLRLIKFIAAIDESHRIILDLLSKGQQFLGIRLGIPCINGCLFLQLLLFQEELLIIRIVEPRLDCRHALSLRSLHRCDDRSAGINPPGSIRFPDLCPELFLRARKSLGKMSILLECDHRLQGLNVSDVENILMAVLIVAPCLHLPEAFHDVRLVLIVLCIAVLRRSLAREFSINGIPATLQHKSPALEVLRRSVLLLILALRVCAHLYDSY